MKWRCTWCGKPHEENDPPCDECGHHKFEKAIEQVPASTGQPQEPVWVCTECGRSHQKHSPPCKRCGNANLEKRRPDYSDLDDLGGTSYLDVLEPRYAVGYVLVAILLGVLALGMVGVIDLPTIGGPSPPDASGHADSYENLSLAGVESAYLEQLNDRREAEGAGRVSTTDALSGAATAYNRGRVAAEFDDESEPSPSEVLGRYDTDCEGDVGFAPYTAPPEVARDVADGDATEREFAENLQILAFGSGDRLLTDHYSTAGVDVHVAPDDTTYVTLFLC